LIARLFICVQGEVSKEEASMLDADGKKDPRCCNGQILQPSGTFPLNATSSEAFSPALFKSHCEFKKRAAACINSEEDESGPWNNSMSLHSEIWDLGDQQAGAQSEYEKANPELRKLDSQNFADSFNLVRN